MRTLAIIVGLLVIAFGGGCVLFTEGQFPPAFLLFLVGGGLTSYALSRSKTKPFPIWATIVVVVLGLALLFGAMIVASLVAEFGI